MTFVTKSCYFSNFPTIINTLYLNLILALSHRNPERILMHQHSASNLTASGGTLPRLGKGFVQNKPRPVAKIVAKTREQPSVMSNSSNSLSDLDPKMQQQQQIFKQNGGKTCSDSQVCFIVIVQDLLLLYDIVLQRTL